MRRRRHAKRAAIISVPFEGNEKKNYGLFIIHCVENGKCHQEKSFFPSAAFEEKLVFNVKKAHRTRHCDTIWIVLIMHGQRNGCARCASCFCRQTCDQSNTFHKHTFISSAIELLHEYFIWNRLGLYTPFFFHSPAELLNCVYMQTHHLFDSNSTSRHFPFKYGSTQGDYVERK